MSTESSSQDNHPSQSQTAENLPVSPEINCMTIVDFKQPWAATLGAISPADVFTGTFIGVGSAAVGAIAAAALVLGLPIAGLVQGYNSSGVLGAVGGLTVGSIVGVAAGATFALAGALFCVFQIMSGVVRTPSTIWGHISGKDWDSDAQEWVYYDLKADADKTLSLSEEQFAAALSAMGSTPAIFSSSTSTDDILESINNAPGNSGSKKTVTDKELYDVLGVAPHATANEIKKAYYIKARQHHPDRNPGDPKAHDMFQKIGAAYQILSDENLRAAYDKKGKEAMENQSMIDASALYALFFGSEQFEYIIGDLQIATQARAFMEHGVANIPVEVLQFKQRKREVQLAVALAKKLDIFVQGDIEGFQEKIVNEATTLSQTTLGAALLGVVGAAYVKAAKSEASSVEGFWSWITHSGSAILDVFNSIAAGYNAASKALELQELQNASEKKNGMTEPRTAPKTPLTSFGPGPGATEQDIQKFRDTTKDMSIQLLHLFWLLVKFDINNTIGSVCKKTLRDHSINSTSKAKRIEGLLYIGNQFCLKGADPEAGIDDLITRIGPQTGLFGEAPKPAADPTSTSSDADGTTKPSEESKGYDDEEKLAQILQDIPTMSSKDIKAHIAALGGSSSDCIEKKDLQRRLKYLLLGRFSDESLARVASVVASMRGIDIDLETVKDREMLMDIAMSGEQ